MNGDDPELDDLLSALRDGPVSLSGVDADQARRARILPAVRQAAREVPVLIARRRKIRRLQQGAAFTLAIAAAFAVALFVRGGEPPPLFAAAEHVTVQSRGEEPLAWHPDGENSRMIEGSDELQTAGELRARDGARAALITQAGAEVQVLPRSRLRVLVRRGKEKRPDTLSLLEGEVHCRVPPLHKGDSFVVKTPSTRVVVHGTEFHVRVREDGESCVSVRDGLVEVQRDGGSIWLGPGSDWGCEDVARASASPSAPERSKAAPAVEPSPRMLREQRREALRTVKVERRARLAASRRAEQANVSAASEVTRETGADEGGGSRAQPARAEDGTLAAETRLLEQALRAEQQGDRVRAGSLFARLIASFPESPLVPEAQAGLDRLR